MHEKMNSHKIACVMSKIISGRGNAPDPARGAYTTLPQSAVEGVNFLPRHLLLNAFGVSLRRLRRLKSNVPLPK